VIEGKRDGARERCRVLANVVRGVRREPCHDFAVTTATLVSSLYIFGPRSCGYTQLVIPIYIVVLTTGENVLITVRVI